MKRNIGSQDKSIRILLAVIILVLYFANLITGTVAFILGILAIVLAVSSFMNFCPLYSIFRFSTYSKKSD